MAINFPNSPIVGNTYDYNGVRYTYQANGYWAVTTPGTVGIASGAEVIVGTDDAKYVTPKAMEDSDYWSARNDGPGSGLDADTVDGKELSSLAQLDSGSQQIFNANLYVGKIVAALSEGGQVDFEASPDSGLSKMSIDVVGADANNHNFRMLQRNSSDGVLTLVFPAVTGEVWTSGNDGSGSGLDADTLDGVDGTQFLRVDVDDFVNGGVISTFHCQDNISASSAGSLKTVQVKQAGASGDAFMSFHISGHNASYFGIDRITSDLFYGGWSNGSAKNRVYHEGNSPKSLAANGYQKLASGLIIQWGVTNVLADSWKTVTLPIAFVTACRSITLSRQDDTGTGAVLDVGEMLSSYIQSTTQIKIGNGYPIGSFNVFWMAIGY